MGQSLQVWSLVRRYPHGHRRGSSCHEYSAPYGRLHHSIQPRAVDFQDPKGQAVPFAYSSSTSRRIALMDPRPQPEVLAPRVGGAALSQIGAAVKNA